MKYLLYVAVAAVAVAACGKDTTAPVTACETEKRAELTALFGASYEPTPSLLLQTQWTFGTTVVVWHPDCSFTKSP